jgi:hypothetical protein
MGNSISAPSNSDSLSSFGMREERLVRGARFALLLLLGTVYDLLGEVTQASTLAVVAVRRKQSYEVS